MKVVRRDAERITHLEKLLSSLSPLATLERGYAIVTDQNGNVMTRSSSAQAGDEVSVRLHQGGFNTIVSEITD
jgi:exodeoxyribonuclease VII large subunit